MDVEQTRKFNLCQPRTVLVSAKFNAVQNVFSGKCALSKRLDNVAAMRVKYFNISLNNTDLSGQSSSVLELRSSLLGGSIHADDAFREATSTDVSTQSATASTDLIAWMVRNSGTNFSDCTGISTSSANNLLRFSRELSIDYFDWTVRPLNAAFTVPLGHPYEIVICLEFFPLCRCQQQLKNPY